MNDWLVFSQGAMFCFFALLNWAMWAGTVTLSGVEMVGKVRLAMTAVSALAMIQAIFSTSVGG